MTKIRDYFKQKYDKNGPAYLQGVLRTIDKLSLEEENKKEDKGVIEK